MNRESAAPAGAGAFDATADIVVVGGGGGGLPAALFSRWNGDEVILLEKAEQLGGTARKAAFWYWVPNNVRMREAGIEDREEDFLRYAARLSRPQQYDPGSPTLGLPAWEHAQIRAIYESASPAAELLADRDALPYRWCEAVPDYWSELPEDKAPTGRVLVPAGARRARVGRRPAGGRTRVDVRRRPGRRAHDERGGGARRRRHPRLPPRPAAGRGRRRRGGRR